jgi:lipoprotein-anchoring transpeptidase ErfK/SrfK
MIARVKSRLLAVAALLLLCCTATASAAAVKSDVYFVQGEGLKPVARQLSQKTVKLAIESLLRGPTAAEAKLDVRSQVPKTTKLRGATVKGGVATLDFTRPFVEGTNRATLLGRLVQVVWTATTVPGVTGVRIWVDGKQAKSMGQGVSVDRTLTRTNVDPPNEALFPPIDVAPDKTGPGSAGGATTKFIQERLVALGYLPSKAITGHLGPWTKAAVLAFQGWEKLQRDAVPGPQTVARLKVAKRPTPLAGTGKRIEVHLTAQVAFLVEGSRVTRVIKVSSGAPGFDTPVGNYAIYRKHLKDWSYPYSVWLPYASYFVGGIAFHESPSVPAYPASHGCVRVPQDDAPAVYAFARLNTPVKVVR